MSQAIKEILTDVIFNVLETMFFAVPEKIGEFSPRAWDIEANISLLSAPKTHIRLLMTRELGTSLAANFLGKEPEEVNTTELLDLSKEMANMIGGNLVTQLGDEAIALGLPESRLLEGIETIDDDPANILSFHIDDEPLMVAWMQSA